MTTDRFQARPPDVTKPTAARLYDYYLGGNAHYAVDTVFAERMFEINPYLDVLCHHNREFLQRACRYLAAECGVRQFLDIGSGIPTVGNTHHIVNESVSDARVVYVDKDEEAVNQSWELLANEKATNTCVIEGDLRQPDSILEHPDIQRLIDFNEPVGLVLVSVWQFVSADDGPYELMAHYRHRLAAGSYVVMTHPSMGDLDDEVKGRAAAVFEHYADTADPATSRNREQFAAFFDGLTIVDPGVVYAPDWRPVEIDTDDRSNRVRQGFFAGVGRKP